VHSIIIEANTRTHLIFSISIVRKNIGLHKIKKIVLITGQINKIKPSFFDIIRFLRNKKISVIQTNRQNFQKHADRGFHSMYTFSYAPVKLLKFKLFTLCKAPIIRYEEGIGNYLSFLTLCYGYYILNFYLLLILAPISRFLKIVLDFFSLTKDEYLINKKNKINHKLRKFIIETIYDLHKKKGGKNTICDALFCINSVLDYKKLKHFINSYKSFVIKPHPRFFELKKKNKFKKYFYSGQLTSEELVFIKKIKDIYAINSSTLIYCSILFKSKCYNIPLSEIKYSVRAKKIFDKFSKNIII
jgi:hypothetical protein